MEHLIILDMLSKVPKRNICMLKQKQTMLSIAAAELEKLLEN